LYYETFFPRTRRASAGSTARRRRTPSLIPWRVGRPASDVRLAHTGRAHLPTACPLTRSDLQCPSALDGRSFAEPTAAQSSSTLRSRSLITSLHLRALSEGERILYVDAQIAYGALDLCVAEQDLHSAQVPCLPIYDGRLGSAQRMGSVIFRA
jgi:hypothetical protein